MSDNRTIKVEVDNGLGDFISSLARGNINTGKNLRSNKKYEESLKAFGKAINQSGGNPKLCAIAHCCRGHSYQDLGKLDQAIKDYETAIRHDKKLYDAYFELAHTFRKKQRYDQALNYYNKALDVANANPSTQPSILSNLLFWLAWTERSMGNYLEASVHIDIAIKFDAHQSNFYLFRAYSYYFEQNYEAAFSEVEKSQAILQGQFNVDFFYLKAKIEKKLGHYTAAAKNFHAATQTHPSTENNNWALAHYELGKLYETGQGVEQNRDTAEMWYKIATEYMLKVPKQAENALIYHSLINAYKHGRGIEKNFTTAIALGKEFLALLKNPCGYQAPHFYKQLNKQLSSMNEDVAHEEKNATIQLPPPPPPPIVSNNPNTLLHHPVHQVPDSAIEKSVCKFSCRIS